MFLLQESQENVHGRYADAYSVHRKLSKIQPVRACKSVLFWPDLKSSSSIILQTCRDKVYTESFKSFPTVYENHIIALYRHVIYHLKALEPGFPVRKHVTAGLLPASLRLLLLLLLNLMHCMDVYMHFSGYCFTGESKHIKGYLNITMVITHLILVQNASGWNSI